VKKLILFGTRHYRPTNIPDPIREALNTLFSEFTPQVVLEEWSEILGQSTASVLASGQNLTWKSIGTPQTQEFKSYGNDAALDFPQSANIQRYGPLPIHEKREKLMCENVAAAMSAYETAVVVIGYGLELF
jgi:hypothetical protein